MRKIILLIMLIFFVITPAFAISKSKSSDVAVIKDELLEHPKFAHKNSIKNEYIPIEDELLNYKPKSNSVFSLEVLKEDEFQDVVIKDELMSDDFLKQAIDTKIEKTDTPNDYFIEKIVDVNKVRKIQPKTVYDFSKKAVLINIKLPDNFQKKNFVLEGNEVPFESTHDFVINGKKFSKGTEIIGRIETFSASDKMGIPESIKISNFYIDLENDINLHGSITKTGANRSYWVYPLYQAGNICFYVAGFVFVPIHGGHAKFSGKDTYTLTYEE